MANYDIFHSYRILDRYHRLDEWEVFTYQMQCRFADEIKTFCFIRIPKTLRVVTRKIYLKISLDLALTLLKLKEKQSQPRTSESAFGHKESLRTFSLMGVHRSRQNPVVSILQYKTIKNLIFLSNSQQLNLSEKESEM